MIAGAQSVAEHERVGIEVIGEAAGLRGAPIPHFAFSTDDVEGPDQFDAWRHNFAPMLDLTPSGEAPTSFFGRQVIWDLGCLALASISTEDLNFASLPGHVRRDPLDHWMMTLFLDGGAETAAADRSFSGGPGSVQVHPLGRQFEGHVSDSQMLMMFVPRDFCRELASTVGAAEFSTLNGGMGNLFADYLAGLANRLPSLSVADIPGLSAATRAMLLACVAPSAERLDEAQTHINGVLLEKARHYINAHLYDQQLNKDALCRELGISRTRLYRLFEPSGGVMRYIQHRRLVDAHRALANPGDTRRILEIAEQRGFNDGAEFSRAFRREFGYSPSEVRSRGMGELPAKPGSDLTEALPEDRLGVLLRRLQG